MKKVLFLSDQHILDVIGGSLGHRRFYDVLRVKNDVNFKVISLDPNLEKSINISFKKTKKEDYLSRLYLHSSFLYLYVDKICNSIVEFQPDIVIIGRSRLGFIAKKLRRMLPEIEIVTNFDNIEYDYVDAQFVQKKGLTGKIIRKIEKFVVKRDEKACIANSDKCIFLTDRDQKRAKELYGFNKYVKTYIFPICLNNEIILSKETLKTNIFFIGNLNYAANVDSILWFLQKIWLPFYAFDKNIILNIAGKNAANVLKDYVNLDNVKIYSDFNSVIDIVTKGALFIAPIQTGAGMKVKIAEALSMGLPIIGTNEAMIGYEDAEAYLKNKGFFFRADTVDEYKQYIDVYANINKEKLETIIENNKTAFNLFYSYKRAENIINDII